MKKDEYMKEHLHTLNKHLHTLNKNKAWYFRLLKEKEERSLMLENLMGEVVKWSSQSRSGGQRHLTVVYGYKGRLNELLECISEVNFNLNTLITKYHSDIIKQWEAEYMHDRAEHLLNK